MKPPNVRAEIIKKLKGFVESEYKQNIHFSHDEDNEIERMIALRLLNPDAFIVLRGFERERHFEAKPGSYPFTDRLEQQLARNWYMKFREGPTISVLRDALAVTGALLSLYLTVRKILGK